MIKYQKLTAFWIKNAAAQNTTKLMKAIVLWEALVLTLPVFTHAEVQWARTIMADGVNFRSPVKAIVYNRFDR